MDKRTEKLTQLLEPAVNALGLELWGCEFHAAGPHSVLTLYIDGPEGITIDDCGKVSQQASAVLDVEDPIASKYRLEVSSPGVERPLYTLSQYQSYLGQQVALKLRVPVAGRRKFNGQLLSAEVEQLTLDVDGETVAIPMQAISKANLVVQF